SKKVEYESKTRQEKWSSFDMDIIGNCCQTSELLIASWSNSTQLKGYSTVVRCCTCC
ncbi:hypothetical protein ACJX0J_039447, partial [Zea mays]